MLMNYYLAIFGTLWAFAIPFVAVFLLVLALRFVRAHERLAKAVEDIAARGSVSEE